MQAAHIGTLAGAVALTVVGLLAGLHLGTGLAQSRPFCVGRTGRRKRTGG